MLRRLLCSTLFPSRRSSDLFLLSLLGASLVAVGVTGELAMDFRSGEIQTGLRFFVRRPVCISPDLKSMASSPVTPTATKLAPSRLNKNRSEERREGKSVEHSRRRSIEKKN